MAEKLAGPVFEPVKGVAPSENSSEVNGLTAEGE